MKSRVNRARSRLLEEMTGRSSSEEHEPFSLRK